MGKQESKQSSGQPAPPHEVELVATEVDGVVAITGCGSFRLKRGSGQHHFNFNLTDNTNLNVRLKQVRDGMLDVEDGCATCPPASGMNTSQIVGVVRQSDTVARFTDRNDDSDEPLAISYQLNFECDEQSKHPITFDPIIINGQQ